MIIVVIVSFCSCNTPGEPKVEAGNILPPGVDTTEAIWTIKFKPASTAYSRQQCLYIAENLIVDSIKAMSGYNGQAFVISRIHEPNGDSLIWQIKVSPKLNAPKFPYSNFKFNSIMSNSDTLPINPPPGGPPSFGLNVFCIQLGMDACQ